MATKTFSLPPGPQAPLDPFFGLGDGLFFPSSKQLALGLAFFSDVLLLLSPAICPPATLKLLSDPNIVFLLTPAEQTAFVLFPSSSPSMTSPLLA